MASRQVSENTFPRVSLFTKGDDSAKMVPARCSLEGQVFGHFVPLPPEVLIAFPQEANFVGSVFWPIPFLTAFLVLFHSRYQRTLIHVPTSIRSM